VSAGLLKHCISDVPRTPPSEVRVVFYGVEVEDGRAYGEPEILKRRRDAQLLFRRTLQFFDDITRDAALLPGIDGFKSFRAQLASKPPPGADPTSPPPFPHLGVDLAELIGVIEQGNHPLVIAPEEFVPRFRKVISDYLAEVDTQLAGSEQSGSR
jgi:hypothetical protein